MKRYTKDAKRKEKQKHQEAGELREKGVSPMHNDIDEQSYARTGLRRGGRIGKLEEWLSDREPTNGLKNERFCAIPISV